MDCAPTTGWPRRSRRQLLAMGAGSASAALGLAGPACAAGTQDRGRAEGPRALRTATLTDDLQQPWGLAFLPGGELLVTEKPGRLKRLDARGRLLGTVAGVPAVHHAGQGGLLDVALDSDFTRNRRLYLSYAERQGADSGTAVARAVLDAAGTALTEVQVIFRQQPKTGRGANHYGGRIVPRGDGTLFITLGDRFTERDRAQTLDNHLGKIVRVRADGSVPPDNPLIHRPGALPQIWSWGHRNIQGAALHPASGELWICEHGPQGGDEVNIARAGRNYGWPVATYGREYGSGAPIGEGGTRADMEPPLTYWMPRSIAPSGLAFCTSDRYAGWRGSVFIGALAGQALWRLGLDGNRVVSREALLTDLGERIRDVRQGPDGLLYLLTDGAPGKLLRLEPTAA